MRIDIGSLSGRYSRPSPNELSGYAKVNELFFP